MDNSTTRMTAAPVMFRNSNLIPYHPCLVYHPCLHGLSLHASSMLPVLFIHAKFILPVLTNPVLTLTSTCLSSHSCSCSYLWLDPSLLQRLSFCIDYFSKKVMPVWEISSPPFWPPIVFFLFRKKKFKNSNLKI